MSIPATPQASDENPTKYTIGQEILVKISSDEIPARITRINNVMIWVEYLDTKDGQGCISIHDIAG